MKQLLVVEDDADIQNQLKWGLSKEYIVIQAANRSEALQLFYKKHPPVVTLDLGLPPDENDSSRSVHCLHHQCGSLH